MANMSLLDPMIHP